jgi:hypothetical protein
VASEGVAAAREPQRAFGHHVNEIGAEPVEETRDASWLGKREAYGRVGWEGHGWNAQLAVRRTRLQFGILRRDHDDVLARAAEHLHDAPDDRGDAVDLRRVGVGDERDTHGAYGARAASTAGDG